MNREESWSFGRLVMRRLGCVGFREKNLLFISDGTVVWRFPDRPTKDRLWFDPHDWCLHYISTIVQHTWRSPIDQVEVIARRLSRHVSLPGYFTVQPGSGITYRSSLSMLPLPEERRLDFYIALWNISWLHRYERPLALIPADPAVCAQLEKETRYLDHMPGKTAYPCGCAYRQINEDFEMMTNGVF